MCYWFMYTGSTLGILLLFGDDYNPIICITFPDSETLLIMALEIISQIQTFHDFIITYFGHSKRSNKYMFYPLVRWLIVLGSENTGCLPRWDIM